MPDQRQRRARPAIKTTPQLRPGDVNALVALYQDGISIRSIARETGLHTQTVSRHLRARGINTMARAHRHWELQPDEIDELITKYSGGMTIKELAEHLDIHRDTIGRYLTANGIDTRPPALDETATELAIQRYEDGWSAKRIAEELGTSSHSVLRRLHAAGIAVRAQGRIRRARSDD